MLAIWLVYRIQLKITKDNNVSEKSRVTRKNRLCSQLNAADKYDTMGPLKLLRHLVVMVVVIIIIIIIIIIYYYFFFYRKGEEKFFFSSKHFPIYKKA